MGAFIAALGQVNPAARIILTVSPVPLAATYSGEHVLLATVHSKAVLRVAAQQLAENFAHVAYFGAYEIVTASGDSAGYFEVDRRTVTDQAVAHVIACFREQFLQVGDIANGPHPPPSAETGRRPMCDEAEVMAALARHAGGKA